MSECFAEQRVGSNGRTVHLVKDIKMITFFQQTAQQLADPSMQRYPGFRFSGPMPITVEECHKPVIRRGSYMFTPKADGVRAALLFCVYFIDNTWQKIVVTIQRDGQCHILSLVTEDILHSNGGSLYDCELIEDLSGRNVLTLFDCYAYTGTNVAQQPLAYRLERCRQACANYVPRAEDTIFLETKEYFKLCRDNVDLAKSFLNNTHTLTFITDGLILVPSRGCGKVIGRSDVCFKMKLDHTIDLVVVREDSELYLASLDEGDDSYVIKQSLDTATIDDANCMENCVLECRMQVDPSSRITSFYPIKPRPDKTIPNTESVIERTVSTIIDAVPIELLV
jgi:hypothetical protein